MPFDVVIVTDVARADEMMKTAVVAVGQDRVLAPALLGIAQGRGDRVMTLAAGLAGTSRRRRSTVRPRRRINLIRQGFEIYLPRYLKRRRHARKVDVVAAPLFPRYVFINIDMATQRWRPIQSTFGVSHLVMNGDEPARRA